MRLERVGVAGTTLSCAVAGEGPAVLCAHGFPDNAGSFRHQVPALVAAGYRVLCPSMRGYAPSDLAADGRYDAATLGRDLLALADHFSPGRPVRLLGHDWGAVAAYAAAALEPERFSHLCTLAVPHLRVVGARFLTPAQWKRSWYMRLFLVPRLGERRLLEKGGALTERLWRDWSPGWSPRPETLAGVKAAFSTPDRARAVLGYYRALPTPRTWLGESARLLFQRTRVPALYVHGERDGCVGVELTEGLEGAYTRGVEVLRIPDAGHFVHQERPEVVNEALLRFFAGEESGSRG